MEVVASVSAAVPVAMLVADKVAKYLKEKGDSGAEENVKQLKSWLIAFEAFIKVKENQQKNLVSEPLVNKIRSLTAEIEDALDDFMFDVPIDHSHTNRLRQAVHNFAHSVNDLRPISRLSNLKQKIKRTIDTEKLLDLPINGTVGLALEDSPSDQFLEEDKMVGFTPRREELRSQLITGDLSRATILVVGPGGSGKTFLVENLYFDPLVKAHFDCRARIRLLRSSSSPQKQYQDFDPLRDTDQVVDEAGVLDLTKLRCYLNQKRYLIVLDNVWSRQAYTHIVNSLPKENTGSRIIITTRNIGVTDQLDYTHKLDGLIEEEAEELFYSRAFPQRQGSSSGSETRCPVYLRKMAEKILERCDGLPLAIAAVGRSLSQMPKVEVEWEKLFRSFASEIGRGSDQPSIFSCTLQPSFVDLPDNLKSCFLYFSIFPEGQSIARGRLIRSWLAEGFVEEKRGKTPEEVAECYLNELVRRSMVRVTTSEIDGRVRSCQVLRFYHEFIVPLSGNRNFVTVMDHNLKPTRVGENVRRLSFHEKFPTKLSEIRDLKHVRTLFVFGHENVPRKDATGLRSRFKQKFRRSTAAADSLDLENVFNKFRLLKVLDLQEVPLQNLPKDIGSFVLLKCLNLRRTKIETVPDTIQKLYLLETLDLKYTLVKELPIWIDKLRNLQHLLVSWGGEDNHASLDEAQGAKVSSCIGSLSSLRKVSLIVVDNLKVIERLGNLVGLRDLGLSDLRHTFGTELCATILKMEHLIKFEVRAITGEVLDLDHMQTSPPRSIQRLHLKGRLLRLPSWISSLPSLVKVVVKWSKLNTHLNPLEILGSLPSLMELEMVDYYIGEKLVFRADKFKNLRKLHIEQFGLLTEAVVEDMSLSMLKSLTICKCKKLKPLAPRYRLGQLEELIVYEMSDAFIIDIRRRIDKGELNYHIQKEKSPQICSSRHIS